MNGRLALTFVALLLLGDTRAESVALWLFDEQRGAHPGSVLKDVGPGSYSLVLGQGAQIVPGKFGNALSTGASAASEKPQTSAPSANGNAQSAAVFTKDKKHVRAAPFANATDSRLNLGAKDWTLECWLQLERDAADEGVIFEIGTGPRGENELLTRLSVVPRENAVVVRHLAPIDPTAVTVAVSRVEFPNPEGPPHGEATLQSVSLVARSPLSRGAWFHLAVVYRVETNELRLFIDGKSHATAAARMRSLPHGAEAYVSIGRDGRGGRSLAGAIDELRVSAAAVYTSEFSAPQSFARRDNGQHLPRP
jgi:hypothetical protein